MAEGDKAVRVRIEGRVQGVWYRGWTVGEATALGLRGWVRNRMDGSVEAVFAGSPGSIDEMVRRCWDGPPAARVTGIRTEDAADPGDGGFRQVSTA